VPDTWGENGSTPVKTVRGGYTRKTLLSAGGDLRGGRYWCSWLRHHTQIFIAHKNHAPSCPVFHQHSRQPL